MNGPSPETLQAQLCKSGRPGDTEHWGGRGAVSLTDIVGRGPNEKKLPTNKFRLKTEEPVSGEGRDEAPGQPCWNR